MTPEIKTQEEKKVIGQRISMSFVENKTFQLWSTFMPRWKEVKNQLNTALISMQVFPTGYDFTNINPTIEFTKWACVEVSTFDFIPKGMEAFTLPGGTYAVFHYTGSSDQAAKVFQYIFNTWLPSSGFTLDERPHFELLGEKYKTNDPESVEEIWVPIK